MWNWRKLISGRIRTGPFVENMPAFSASDWILIWLGLDKSKRISGKTIFIKQLFIVGKERQKQVDQVFDFFPHKYGPYSKEFENALRSLVKNEFISENVIEDYNSFSPKNRHDFKLKELGEIKANQLINQIPDRNKNELLKYRKILARMGFWGIIRYVYENYPDYAITSEISIE